MNFFLVYTLKSKRGVTTLRFFNVCYQKRSKLFGIIILETMH